MERLRQRGQVPATRLGDDHEVLDADPTEPRVIQAWLDGDHITDLEHHVGLADPWELMDLETESVPRAVDETRVALNVAIGLGERPVAMLLEDLAAREVDVATVDAGPHGVEPGLLRLEHGLPHALDLRRRCPAHHSARHVTPVSRALVEGVDVEHDREPFANHVAHGTVWICGLRSAAADRILGAASLLEQMTLDGKDEVRAGELATLVIQQAVANVGSSDHIDGLLQRRHPRILGSGGTLHLIRGLDATPALIDVTARTDVDIVVT